MKIFLLKKIKQRLLNSYVTTPYHVFESGDVVEIIVVVLREILELREALKAHLGLLPVMAAARHEAGGSLAFDVVKLYVERNLPETGRL